MADSAQMTITCPTCGKPARVSLDWIAEHEAPHATAAKYECPSGCDVDEQTIREIIGAQ